MAEHTIYGTAAPPWPITGHDDDSPIVTANAFYSTATTWYVVGARLYVPTAAPIPAQITLGLRLVPYLTMVDLSTPALVSQTVDAHEGWVEARWTGVELAPTIVAWISNDAGDYYSFGTPPDGLPFQSLDLVDLYMAENAEQKRAAFRTGTGATTSTSRHYGLGLIVSDSPGASGGGQTTIMLTPRGAGFSRREGSAKSAIQLSSQGSGISHRSDGFLTGIEVSDQGAGFKTASGGSFANMGLSGQGSGLATRQGGSSADVEVTAQGSGTRLRRGGSMAAIVVTAQGSGQRIGTRQGGSAASVHVSAQGVGYNPSTVNELPETANLTLLIPDRGLTLALSTRGLEMK